MRARPELVVQKLTEIGVDHIVPFVADRSIVRWDPDKAAHHHARLQKVAREAAMQSRRAWLPEVAEVTNFGAVAMPLCCLVVARWPRLHLVFAVPVTALILAGFAAFSEVFRL